MAFQGSRHSMIREARSLYDVRAVLGLADNKRVIVCPMPQHPHHNNTPSFSIYMDGRVQKFACHGSCGLKGDVIDLVGYMQVPNYDPRNGEHVKRALSILEGGYKISPVKAQPRAPAIANTADQDFLPAGIEVIEYARSRGLMPETLQQFHVGQSALHNKTWMTIPTFHMGRLMGIKLRNLHPVSNKDRYNSLPGSIGGLFNANDVFYHTGPVLIVKAEIPAMLLKQHGFKACAPTGGESSSEAELFSFMAWTSRRIVVKDNDRDPEVRRKMDIAAARRAEVFRAELKAPPEEFKDIDEWILADAEYALRTIRRWVE